MVRANSRAPFGSPARKAHSRAAFIAKGGLVAPKLTVARLATDGHSFADYEDGAIGGPPQGRRRANRGVGFWLQYLSGGKIMCPLSRNFGVSGQTSQQIAARVAATVSSAADCGGFLVFSPQINDRGGANLTLQQSIDATVTYLDGLVATGKPTFYVATTPRDATLMTGTDANGIAQTQNFLDFLAWERAGLVARYGKKVTVSDRFEDFVDTTRSPRVSPIGGTAGGGRNPTMDGTHLSPSGSFTEASDLLPKIIAQAAAGALVDPFTAMLQGRTNLVVNPGLTNTGTPGTKSGSGTLTGTIPSGVTAVISSNHAATITIDKATGSGVWLELADTYSGTATSDAPELRFDIGAVADGDTVQFAIEVERDAVTGAMIEFAAGLRIGTSGTTMIAAEGYRSSSVDFIPLSATSGVLICEPVTISGLGAGTATLFVRMATGAAAAQGAFRVKKNRIALVKL